MPQHSVGRNDEGRAAHAALHDPIARLRLPHSVQLAHLALFVGEQFDRQAVLVAEVGVGQAIVGADADHDALFLREVGVVVAEIDGLTGAAGVLSRG
jgi:hypothetical protein